MRSVENFEVRLETLFRAVENFESRYWNFSCAFGKLLTAVGDGLLFLLTKYNSRLQVILVNSSAFCFHVQCLRLSSFFFQLSSQLQLLFFQFLLAITKSQNLDC